MNDNMRMKDQEKGPFEQMTIDGDMSTRRVSNGGDGNLHFDDELHMFYR